MAAAARAGASSFAVLSGTVTACGSSACIRRSSVSLLPRLSSDMLAAPLPPFARGAPFAAMVSFTHSHR